MAMIFRREIILDKKVSKTLVAIESAEKNMSVIAMKINDCKIDACVESKNFWKLPAAYKSVSEMKIKKEKSVILKNIFCKR